MPIVYSSDLQKDIKRLGVSRNFRKEKVRHG
jgi:hypothetical protein